MLVKKAQFSFIDIQPLNTPKFGDAYDFIVDQRLKVANDAIPKAIQSIKLASKKSAEIETDGDNTEFDLEAEVKSHPDSLYVKCFAIKADEPNDNGDNFPYDELKKATSTFVGVPIFTNHNNSDVEESRGRVVHSWWNEERKGIMIIARVDAEAYPKLARGIKDEYIMGTSMGCQVQYSLCSICHNKAETPDQYCSHIRERKTRKISDNNVKCNYHEHGNEESCPMCDCKKDETKKLAVHDLEAFENNYGIKFIENSFVVNPACHECGVTEIIDPKEFIEKLSSITQRMLKVANAQNLICDDKQCIRIAGQEELNQLGQALDLMTSVSQSMLQQKDQLDLEFLSDLISVVADLQKNIDELTQQGYGRLQSPEGSTQEALPGSETPQTMPAATETPMPTGTPKIHTGPAGEAGSVTSPMAEKQINFAKLGMLQSRCEKVLNMRKDRKGDISQRIRRLNMGLKLQR